MRFDIQLEEVVETHLSQTHFKQVMLWILNATTTTKHPVNDLDQGYMGDCNVSKTQSTIVKVKV